MGFSKENKDVPFSFSCLSVRVAGDVTAFYTTILQGGAGVTGAKSSSRWA